MNKDFDGFGNDIMTQDGATFTINGQTREYADIWHRKIDENPLEIDKKYADLDKVESEASNPFGQNDKAEALDNLTIEDIKQEAIQKQEELNNQLKIAQQTNETQNQFWQDEAKELIEEQVEKLKAEKEAAKKQEEKELQEQKEELQKQEELQEQEKA